MNRAPTHTTRIFLVDDEQTVLRGLQTLLSMQPQFTICGKATDVPTGTEGISQTKPDVAVVDLSFHESDRFDLIERIHCECPDTRILVFSTHENPKVMRRALSAGASGYVTKPEVDQVVEAILHLVAGEAYLSPTAREKLLGSAPARNTPAAREGPDD